MRKERDEGFTFQPEGREALPFERNGVPGGSTSQTEETANSKPLYLERSSSCLRKSRKPV